MVKLFCISSTILDIFSIQAPGSAFAMALVFALALTSTSVAAGVDFSVTSSASTFAAVPENQMSTLEDFYFSTGGPTYWLESTGWNFTGAHNPCAESWYESLC